jgi:excinuclease UvrABC nuclease subunit
MRRLSVDNLRKGKIPNRSGLYILYNPRKRPIYVGHSRRLRHRIQSYIEVDDYTHHPTKRALRNEARYFKYRTMPIRVARRVERRMKKVMKHNHK